MEGAPAHSIFCCTDAVPVLTESAFKIHNDPNRDFHDAICQSFMEFALRQQRSATLYALINNIRGNEMEGGSEKAKSQRPDPPARSYTTPTKPSIAMSPLTPPFTPVKKLDTKGKEKERDELCNVPSRLPVENSPGQHDATATDDLLIDLLRHYPSTAPNNRPRTSTLPSRSSDLSSKYDASRLRSSSSVGADSSAPSLSGFITDTPSSNVSTTTKKDGSINFSQRRACSTIHDHVMVVPSMPHPNYPTPELLRNPLTKKTEYVMHLTSRHDYGPVYSHRYFVCPRDLRDDWIELTLLQWFACGEPFKMKAEKWDIKCEDDSRFFRMTLRPNLNMRSIQLCYPE